ncbi:ABC transporter permease [Neptuniibacter marinus]|uniref:ABC transporter permease n=1 Tax=Neptuniibacter marinus TaxID=1806670 RepID=UPI003B59756A
MTLFHLTWKSFLNRKATLLMMLLSISMSVVLLLGVDIIRQQAKEGFSSTISSTDLIVGARSGQINLLLYSVFHIGNATNNITWKSYENISQDANVKWSIPLSLGDSHRGFRVLGTSSAYFEHYRYGAKQPLAFSQGRGFEGLFDVVIGAEVAKKLGYNLGSPVVIAHGMGSASLMKHDDKPFNVVGILKPTGTPVDNTLIVSLEAIEAIHVDWQSGVQLPGSKVTAEQVLKMNLKPKQITAFMLGLNSRLSTFHLQRKINQYRNEPLMAILPGLALQELWGMFSFVEKTLFAISGLVVVSGVLGLLALLLSSLNERRREMAILRSVGARPIHILTLLILESLLVTLLSVLLGIGVLYLVMFYASPLIQDQFGVRLAVQGLSLWQWQLVGMVVAAGALAGLVPGYRAYRHSLADGMSIKL